MKAEENNNNKKVCRHRELCLERSSCEYNNGRYPGVQYDGENTQCAVVRMDIVDRGT